MTGSAAIREWRIQIGVHKTANTHLNEVLERQAPAILDAGVDYVLRDISRPPLKRLFRTRPHRLLALSMAVTGRLPAWVADRDLARIRAGLAPHLTGRPAVLLTEENILGSSTDGLRRRLYPNLTQVAALGRLARDAEVTLFLTIRALDAFLPSAYAEALKYDPAAPALYADACAAARGDPPRWTDLIARLRRAAPGARLRVLDYDDYAAHWADFAALVVGRPLPPVAEPPRPQRTMSPSAEAVAAAEALDLPASAERTGRVRALYAAMPAGSGSRLAPFDADTAARLRAHHAAELALIDRRHPGMRIRFGAAAAAAGGAA
jgi:hypothetical protein